MARLSGSRMEYNWPPARVASGCGA